MAHRGRPARHVGDYPHGYWSADVPPDHVEEESYEVSGTTIRFMPDDTVTVPLWDEDGLLPEDPAWLNQALGLSAELVADIAAWGTTGTPQVPEDSASPGSNTRSAAPG